MAATALDTAEPFDPEKVAAELEGASAEESLRWAIETFHPKLYIAASFQKTSSVTRAPPTRPPMDKASPVICGSMALRKM